MNKEKLMLEFVNRQFELNKKLLSDSLKLHEEHRKQLSKELKELKERLKQ